jgi:hypothetical protein
MESPPELRMRDGEVSSHEELLVGSPTKCTKQGDLAAQLYGRVSRPYNCNKTGGVWVYGLYFSDTLLVRKEEVSHHHIDR